MATPNHNLDDNGMLHVIATQITSLHDDVGDMKAALKDLASAIIKLALVEERQGQTSVQLERAFKVMERLDARVVILEVAAPLNKQTNAWVLSGVWAAVGVIALVVLKSVGVL